MLRPRLLPIALAAALLAGAACGDGGTDASGADARCRTVTHEVGEACVPAHPARIAVVDPVGALPTLIDLDAPIVGAVSVYDTVFPDYLTADELDGIEIVGGSQSVDVEAIAALRPDLVVGSVAYLQDAYDQLAEIAPTVVITDTYYTTDWQQNLLTIADLVGGRDQLEERLDGIDERAAALADSLAEAGEHPGVTRMDLYQGGAFVFRHQCVWWGELVEAAGVTQPRGQQGSCTEGTVANGYVQVAPEQLEIVDADLVLVYDFQGGSTGSDAFRSGSTPAATRATRSPL